MRIQVIGATRVATQLVGLAQRAGDVAEKSSEQAARAIADDWDDLLARGRTDYTASRTWTEPVSGLGATGHVVANDFFIARLLQNGTGHHEPKVDLFGAADPHVERWRQSLTEGLT